jgi:hypothetical protein
MPCLHEVLPKEAIEAGDNDALFGESSQALLHGGKFARHMTAAALELASLVVFPFPPREWLGRAVIGQLPKILLGAIYRVGLVDSE